MNHGFPIFIKTMGCPIHISIQHNSTMFHERFSRLTYLHGSRRLDWQVGPWLPGQWVSCTGRLPGDSHIWSHGRVNGRSVGRWIGVSDHREMVGKWWWSWGWFDSGYDDGSMMMRIKKIKMNIKHDDGDDDHDDDDDDDDVLWVSSPWYFPWNSVGKGWRRIPSKFAMSCKVLPAHLCLLVHKPR